MSVMMVLAMLMAVMVVEMIRALDVASARHHENMAVGAHHMDFGAIEPGQDRGGHHLLDGTEHRLAAAEIKHAIERAEQLVEFMRAEQHRDLALAADLPHDLDR